MRSDSQISKGYCCSVTITDSSDPGIFSLYFPGEKKYICARSTDTLVFVITSLLFTLIVPLRSRACLSDLQHFHKLLPRSKKNRIRLSYPALAFHFLFFTYFCLTKYGLHQHHIKHRSPSYAEQCTLLPFM